MGQVTWSPAATRDVDDIAAYIARDSVEESSLFVVRLVEATNRLGKFPESGRIIPQFGDSNRREIIVGAYRIMYEIRKGNVLISGVVHGAREFPPA